MNRIAPSALQSFGRKAFLRALGFLRAKGDTLPVFLSSQQKAATMSWSPKKCVVVPVDFSTASETAIRTALELVRSPGDVHVIHVVNVPDYIPYGEAVWVVEPTEWLAKAELHMKEYIESHSEFRDVTWATVTGEPDAGIVKYAGDHKADLIVMPCHGLRGLKRLLMGSVTSGVLRNAPCEVLVQRFTSPD